MTSRPVFYWGTIKNLIVAFGSIFDKVTILNDFDEEIIVPLIYAPKEKFIAYFQEKPTFPPLGTEQTSPRMGFELSGLNFSPDRFNNPLNRMLKRDGDGGGEISMYSRIPYDFNFTLYVGTKSFEESLKIVESIVPFFTPELNLTIRDREEFDLTTDVPIILNTTGFSIDYEGSFDARRQILWTLTFTAKAWLYGDTKHQGVIKKTIMNFTQKDYNRIYTILTSEVVPKEAEKYEPHTIVDTIEENYSDLTKYYD